MSLPGGGELIVVLLIVMMLFGASRLPKLARSMGQAGKEFKAGIREGAVESEQDRSIEGRCPFCRAEIPAQARFCPGCAREADEITSSRSQRVPQKA